MANRSVQQFLHSSRHTVPILYNGQPFSPKLALSWGSGTPSNSCFLGPIRDHNPNITTIVLAVFAQVTAECAYTLPWAPLSRKSALPMGIWTLYLTRFLEPIRAHNPNSISIGSAIFAHMTIECPYTLQWDVPFLPQNCPSPSAIFAGLTSVTNRPTDRPRYSVSNNRLHLCT